jgi:hypothetical protein
MSESCRLSRRLIRALESAGVDWPGGEFNAFLSKPQFRVENAKWELRPITDDNHPLVFLTKSPSKVVKNPSVVKNNSWIIMQ